MFLRAFWAQNVTKQSPSQAIRPCTQAAALKAALSSAQRAQNVEAAQEAQKTLRELVAKSKAEGKVNDQEAWYGLVGGLGLGGVG